MSRSCLIILASLWTCSLLSCDGRIQLGTNASWTARTGEFNWGRGTVNLPPGWTYAERGSADSFAGAFVAPDREQWLGFDIGGYAGLWAKPEDCLFEERVVDGARVWTAQHCPDGDPQTTNRYAVTFPDSGPANFHMRATNTTYAEPIWFIARSFRPRGPVTRVQWP